MTKIPHTCTFGHRINRNSVKSIKYILLNYKMFESSQINVKLRINNRIYIVRIHKCRWILHKIFEFVSVSTAKVF